MNSGVNEASELLREVISLMQRPGTEVIYSQYGTAEEAVLDLGNHLAQLTSGDLSKLRELEILFAPTGSIQDISIDSGWGEHFLALAARMDGAIEKMSGLREKL